jgi:predicted RNA-binding Zn-ribbon protein involved in translation (DUF1610 family)
MVLNWHFVMNKFNHKKGSKMKNAYCKIITVCAVLVLLSGKPLHAQSIQFNQIDGQPIHNQAEMDALTTGDTVAMVCPKCKSASMTTYSSDPSSSGHVKWMQADSQKTCSICGGKVTTVTEGNKTKFVCSKCGDSTFVTAFKTAQK